MTFDEIFAQIIALLKRRGRVSFDEIFAQIIALLKRQGRVSYGALKRRYALDDAYLEDLKDAIIYAQRLAVDEDNRVLVWVGNKEKAPTIAPATPEPALPATNQEREPLQRLPMVSRGDRTLSLFVGRERELAVLDKLLEQVKASQGKSRLLYEFRNHLQDKRVTYLEGRCLSYASSVPYLPIIYMVRNNCGITETDSHETISEKVRQSLREVGITPEESAPYVLQLLDVKTGTEALARLTPEAIRTRTFETLQQMSLKGSQQCPLIFAIEDLQWIDKTSADYLAFLVERLPGAAILLLTTYRPGYSPPWLAKSYATQISLRSLVPHDALTVVHSTSQHKKLPAHLEKQIIDNAEGNPFFLQELTHVVIRCSDLQADIAVPDTTQGVLSARIDRLLEGYSAMTRIFLCHANEDKSQVREVYQRLKTEGFEPWLDEEDLLPGQLWEQEIRRALKKSDLILIFFSQNSVAKRGYVQKEMKLALDTWEEIPEGQIHTIPVRLNNCQIPDRFKKFQWVNLFDERGFERVVRAIRSQQMGRDSAEDGGLPA